MILRSLARRTKAQIICASLKETSVFLHILLRQHAHKKQN